MRKVTVQRAYGRAGRILVNSEGCIYAGIAWVECSDSIIRVGEPYDSWSDVPLAWMGHVPYWSNRR